MWKYAEDIIEFIAGYREISGKLLQPWERIPSPLSLARYDVQILDSLALQTVDNSRAYTQKQSELALKIIHKYRKQLNKLGHYDRPIHCADQKREVLYIKNDNQWFKETEEKPILTKAIKTIANENIKQIKTILNLFLRNKLINTI